MNKKTFLTLFDKNFNEFVNSFEYSKDKILDAILFYQNDGTIGEIIDLIKEAEIDNNINILRNLIYLYPFSSLILEKILKEVNPESLSVDEKLEIIWSVNKTFNKLLKDLRIELKDSKLKGNFFEVIEKNEKVLNNLQKERDLLLKKKNQEKTIEKLKNEIEDLKRELNVNNKKELEKKLSFYENKKEELKQIKRFINEHKKVFEKLMKDKV